MDSWRSPIIRSGYLLKKGQLRTSWKCRWCVLCDDKLFYFKSEAAASTPNNKLGFIALGYSVIRSCTEDVGKDFCFEIVTEERVWKLVAGAHQEMVDWIQSLVPRTMLQGENDLIKAAEHEIRLGAKKNFTELESQWKFSIEDLEAEGDTLYGFMNRLA